MRNKKLMLCGAAAAVIAIAPSIAAAQTAQPTETAPAQPAAPTEYEGTDIVVTAQKRPELLSKAPAAISAITGDALKTAGVVDPMSISNLVPSAQIQQANGLQITIRGVSSPDGTEKGDPSAAFQLNGVYLARQQSLGGSFFDLERVEVLRGPQGTLYGRNATAGVVNVLTKRPKFGFEAGVNGEVSNYDTYRADVMLNLPLGDNFAIRAAGAINKHDSYLINPNGSNKLLGFDQDEKAARLSALWEFGGNRQGSLFLVGDYTEMGGIGPQAQRVQEFYSNVLTTQPLWIAGSSEARRTIRYPITGDARRNNKVYGITGELNYDFGGIGVTYLGSYRVFDRDEFGPFPFPKPGLFPNMRTVSQTKSQSHELRLATTGDGPLSAVAGLYYFRESTSPSNALLQPFSGFTIFGFLHSSVVGESRAVFGQATYKITPSLRLTGGIRYSEDEKSREGILIGQNGSTEPDPARFTILGRNDAERSFSKVTWKVGIDYDVSSRILAYGTVSTGYKAGGFNDGCLASSPGCASPIPESRLFYQPEELTAYEIGLKGRYLDNALTLNLSGFYYDYTNLQLNSQQEPPAPAGQITLNAGKARIKGAEIEAVVMPDRNNRFDFSVALLDAHYVEYFPKVGISFAGRDLDNSPSATVFAGYTRTFQLASGARIDAHVDTRFSSAYVMSDPATPAQFEQPAFTKTNASITYTARNNRWYLQGFLKNAENEVTVSGYQGGRIFLSEPRLYGVRAGVKF